jgi:hypothetical protein
VIAIANKLRRIGRTIKTKVFANAKVLADTFVQEPLARRRPTRILKDASRGEFATNR